MAITALRARQESIISSRTIIAIHPISIALLIIFLIRDVLGHHTMMCYRQDALRSIEEYKNFRGLGTDRIPETDVGVSIWQVWSTGETDFIALPNNNNIFGLGYKFTLYPLYYSKGNHMTGWYRLQINNWGQQQSYIQRYGSYIISYVLWAQNENYEFVGEWLTDDQFQPINDPRFKNCPKNDATRYMGISCGGAYPTQPSVSNTIRFIANMTEDRRPIYFNFSKTYIGPPVHPNDLTEINYYFRLSAQSCDTVKRDVPFRPRNIVKHNGILFSIKTFPWHNTAVHPGLLVHEVMYEVTEPGAILGGADPLDLVSGEVDCSRGINENDHNKNNPNFPWFAKSFHPRTHPTEISPKEDWSINREYGCQAVQFGGRCKHNLNRPIRSNSVLNQQNVAKPDVSYQCNNNVSKYVTLNGSTTIDYAEFLTNQSVNFMEKCSTDEEACSHRIIIIDGKSTKDSSSKKDHNHDEKRGLHVNHFKNVWNSRKGHGIMMVILTLFLIPVSAFFARYFKESFMNQRIFFARIWYAIHSHMSGWIFAFTFAGAFVAFVNRGALGKSLTKAAKTHHILAYVSYAILILVFLGSGLRSYDERSRRFSICFHWALGTLFYLLNIGALLTSMWIPASPIALIDHSLTSELREQFNLPSGFDFSFVLIIGWLVFDVLAHLVMTIGIIISDNKMQVILRRSYCPSPIPVIREDQTTSANGSAFRTIMLFIYISVSIVVTAALCFIITFESESDGRGYGPMSCTHIIAQGVIKSKLPKISANCYY